MLSAIAYIFLFSTWGLGLMSWLVLLSAKLQETELKSKEMKLGLQHKELLFNGLSDGFKKMQTQPSAVTPWGKVSDPKQSEELIPDKILELMSHSKDHPEVNEIDGSDEILGVRFEAQNYPPIFDEEDE
jgi:hypothetical protein